MLQCKTKNLYFKKKLGDLILFLRNGISNEQVDIYTDFPVTRIETIADGKIDYNRVGHVEKAPEDYKILQWDILVSNINSQKHIGKVAIKDDDKVLYHGMNLLLMRPNETIDSKFLFYVLNFNKQYFERIASPAVNQSSINQIDMQKMEFIIPKDKSKQEQIANILSTCDEVIEKTEETIEKYKQIKADMIQDLFTRGLDKNGKLRPTYAQSPDLYKYSEELDRYIPKEWDVKPMELVVKRISDIDHYMPKSVEDGIPYIMTGDFIGNNDLDFKNAKKISVVDYETLSRKIKPEFNDIIIARYATVGTIRIVKTNKPFLVSYSCAIIKTDKNLLNPDYLAYYIKSNFCQNLMDLEINASTQKNIGIDTLKTISVFVPQNNKEQNDIVKALNAIETKIETEEQYLNKYEQIKQGLMKRLLTPPADAEIVEE